MAIRRRQTLKPATGAEVGIKPATPAQDRAVATANADAARREAAQAHAQAVKENVGFPGPNGQIVTQAEADAAGQAARSGAPTPPAKAVLPTPPHRTVPGRPTVAPRTVPASIVPPASPSAGAAKVAGVVAGTNASGAEPAAGGTSSTQLPAPQLTTGTASGVLSQTQINQSEAAVQTLLGQGVPADVAKNALAFYENEQIKGITDQGQIANDLYASSWFKQAFPGITAALANGISPPDPITYSKDYSAVQSMLTGFGIPTGAVSPQLYGELVGRGLSSADIKNNIGNVFSAAPAVSQAAQADLAKWYGVPNNPGAIAALLIDPQGALARENGGNGLMPPSAQLAQTVGTAAVGGALAGQSGFSKLSKQDLITMAGSATSTQIGNAASADIGALGATETGTKNAPTVTEAQLLESGGSSNSGIQANKGAQQAVERAVGARTAQFGGGGGAAGAGQPGTSGAGYGSQ